MSTEDKVLIVVGAIAIGLIALAIAISLLNQRAARARKPPHVEPPVPPIGPAGASRRRTSKRLGNNATGRELFAETPYVDPDPRTDAHTLPWLDEPAPRRERDPHPWDTEYRAEQRGEIAGPDNPTTPYMGPSGGGEAYYPSGGGPTGGVE